jgi:branched-chain amino acid transport system ATP-binding protein
MALEILDFVGLAHRSEMLAHALPYGEQRKLEIAIALASGPRLLLLDEPAAGMNPDEGAKLVQMIQRIRERGITVLLVEHHMKVVMGVCDRVIVLDSGRKIAEGRPAEVVNNPEVIRVYLGREKVDA